MKEKEAKKRNKEKKTTVKEFLFIVKVISSKIQS